MMRVLVDTSAYSAFMRGHPEVKLAIQRADQIYLSPVILGELLAGFIRGGRQKKNQKELQAFLESPRVTLVSVDEETAERYAVILNALWRAGTPIPTNDIWIAASAMQHGLHLLTTDPHYRKIVHIIVDYVETS
ncbi:MAG TPA: type II toxin-antitoxin system VapC family toxin [Patescibacteria group bacterium]|nr:type II toxin-antitoxin system VapC family toxin [Patescibacteria group bacterium]